ncbi:MAG TPA: malto-oligosyltrehalose trehalohydrolase, partial [Isosphaeraceae bacterium]|nr:malto-oligosyltrehalose trehalohydrolase [Isosphaeraceae bacterium]
MNWRPTFGAWPDGGGIRFRVWAPGKQTVEVVLEGPEGRVFPLEKHADETFGAIVPDIEAGARYRYCVDGRGPFPDPASRFQPDGVHGPSEVMDPIRFGWTDLGWQGVSAA